MCVKNVVIIVVDALRADRVGSIGDCNKRLTPNIDSLAPDSYVFENAFACAPQTGPSVTTIHTGRYPITTVYHHGLISDVEKKRIDVTHRLPEYLSEREYRTVNTGRHLNRWQYEGFEYPQSSDPRKNRIERAMEVAYNQLGVKSVLDGMNDLTPNLQDRIKNMLRLVYKASESETPEYNNYTAVQKLFENIEDGQPFYGFVHLLDTHRYYSAEHDMGAPDQEVVEELIETYDYPHGMEFDEFLAEFSDQRSAEFLEEGATERDREYGLGRYTARYDASVRSADEKIGNLITELKENGKWNETVLVITADHGESLGEHDIYYNHHGLYDVTIRVPLLIHFPGEGSGQFSEMVQLIDIAPTLYDILDLEHPSKMDGKSLLPLMNGDRDDWTERDFIWAEEAYSQRRVAIRTEKFKYIRHIPDNHLENLKGSSFDCWYCSTVHGGKEELYDLQSDPEECENIVDNRPAVAQSLREKLESFMNSLEYPDVSDTDEITYNDEEEAMEQLRQLGYVD